MACIDLNPLVVSRSKFFSLRTAVVLLAFAPFLLGNGSARAERDRGGNGHPSHRESQAGKTRGPSRSELQRAPQYRMADPVRPHAASAVTPQRPVPHRGVAPANRVGPAPAMQLHRAAPGFRPHESLDRRHQHSSLDSRHGRTRFYPPLGHSVTTLPGGHRSYYHGGRPYYFHSGIWYGPRPYGFVVTRPPVGMLIPVLPGYHSIVWFGNTRYYFANNVYYLPAAGGYAVVEAPVGPPTRHEEISPAGASDPGPFTEGTWYLCEASSGYYPHVGECADGWIPVPAIPAELAASASSLAPDSWFWCEESQTYYPYVRQCGQPWRAVPGRAN